MKEAVRTSEHVAQAEGRGAMEPKHGPRKFYDLSVAERVEQLRSELKLDERVLAALGRPDPLSLDVADKLIENVVGVFPLPLGVARNFRVNGRDLAVPMAIEEPSVVAAASHGAKLLRSGGGIRAEWSEPVVVGQIFLADVPDFERAEEALEARRAEILEVANGHHPKLVAVGGGARGFELRRLRDAEGGVLAVFELAVDVRDAMGANVVNSMCEETAPLVGAATGGRAGMRILTNLCDRRTARASGRVPKEVLGESGVRRIAEASMIAELDPYRAVTHNKGAMNGIDAFLIALGQDFRAVEAGAHAYAARSGAYRPLAVWRTAENGDLEGRIELPLSVGIVGGRIGTHPSAAAALRLVEPRSAQELAGIAAAVGLAQNLAAVRALSHEGIQAGHMRLHWRADRREESRKEAAEPVSTGSASAKAILCGEHAVVYGLPAIAIPLRERRMEVTLKRARGSGVKAEGALDDRRGLVEGMAALALGIIPERSYGAKVGVRSTIPPCAGLGSSAALAVGLVRAVDGGLGAAEVARFANELEALAHGTPSGIDAQTVAHERPILFQKGESPRFLTVRLPFRFLVAVLPRAGTTQSLVAGVRKRAEAGDPAFLRFLEDSKEIVPKVARILERGGKDEDLAALLERCQRGLESLGLVPPRQAELCRAVVAAGALAAKMSGAGGGGATLALLPSTPDPALKRRVLAAAKASGAVDAFVTELS